MKRSRRELSIDMIIHRGIFKDNQITLFPLCYLHSYLKQGLVFTVKDLKSMQKTPKSSTSKIIPAMMIGCLTNCFRPCTFSRMFFAPKLFNLRIDESAEVESGATCSVKTNRCFRCEGRTGEGRDLVVFNP